jgi:membrane-associated phospholipid phosphatase
MPAKRPPRLPGAAGRSARARLAHSVNRFRQINWSVPVAVGLVLFVAGIPGQVRDALLRGILAQPFMTAMLIIFGLLALSLLWSAGQRVDAWAFLFINFRGRRPPWLDGAMLGLTQLGSALAPAGLAIGLFLANESDLAYEVILGSLTLVLVVELAKIIFRRSRPFVRLTQTRIVGYRARGRSFPSGHTSQAFYLAALLLKHFHLGIEAAVGLYLLAVLVAVTRMYIGAHYPRDVLAGAILGSVWGLLGVVMDANFALKIG